MRVTGSTKTALKWNHGKYPLKITIRSKFSNTRMYLALIGEEKF